MRTIYLYQLCMNISFKTIRYCISRPNEGKGVKSCGLFWIIMKISRTNMDLNIIDQTNVLKQKEKITSQFTIWRLCRPLIWALMISLVLGLVLLNRKHKKIWFKTQSLSQFLDSKHMPIIYIPVYRKQCLLTKFTNSIMVHWSET